MASLRAVLAFALAALATGSSPAVAADANWRWPAPGPVVQGFHVAHDRFARGQHRGVDLAARPGAPVRSACAGRVSFAGFVPRGGRTVSVRCGPLTATYQHLSAFAVRRGAPVTAGARLGAAGATALHFGVHRTADRHAYLDPLSLLGGEGRRPAPPVPVATRRPSSDPLGRPPPPRPSPRLLSARPAQAQILTPRRKHAAVLTRPAAGQTEPGGVPRLAWIGAGLVVLALPGWGVRCARRRYLRAAPKRIASTARVSQSA